MKTFYVKFSSTWTSLAGTQRSVMNSAMIVADNEQAVREHREFKYVEIRDIRLAQVGDVVIETHN
jgi:hypothetical protein